MFASYIRKLGWFTAVFGLLGLLLTGGSAASTAATAPTVAGAIPVGPALTLRDLPSEFAATAATESAALAPGEVRHGIQFHFKKNKKHPTQSRLILFRVTYYPNRSPQYTKLGEWRAGSGIGGTGAGQNPCTSNQGWLPNGTYDGYDKNTPGVYFTNYNGGLIFGTVWHLQDKHCKADGKGTLRTDLFIHSEMTPDRKQACQPAYYRENQCWDGQRDYISKGCIKLKPNDIAEAARLAKAWGGPKPGQKHYANLLVVTN